MRQDIRGESDIAMAIKSAGCGAGYGDKGLETGRSQPKAGLSTNWIVSGKNCCCTGGLKG